MFKRLTDSFHSSVHQTRRRRSRPPVLNLEALEDRRLLATFTVTSNIDGPVAAAGDLPGSLRQAIFDANANPGDDTIEFDASIFDAGFNSVVRLAAGELKVTDTLTIANSSQGSFTIDARENSRVLNFSASTGNLTLEGLTITGGKLSGDNATSAISTDSGGGILFGSNGTLSLVRSSVSENRTVGDDAPGGGIFTREGGVSLIDSSITNNRTSGDFSKGGGIAATSGNVALLNSTLSGNRTSGDIANGGGVFARYGAVTVANSMFNENRTTGNFARGGGIYTRRGSVLVTNSTISENGTVSSGGGIYTESGAIRLESSTLSGNSATGISSGGGGAFVARSFGGDGGGVVLLNSTALAHEWRTREESE